MPAPTRRTVEPRTSRPARRARRPFQHHGSSILGMSGCAARPHSGPCRGKPGPGWRRGSMAGGGPVAATVLGGFANPGGGSADEHVTRWLPAKREGAGPRVTSPAGVRAGGARRPRCGRQQPQGGSDYPAAFLRANVFFSSSVGVDSTTSVPADHVLVHLGVAASHAPATTPLRGRDAEGCSRSTRCPPRVTANARRDRSR
jgi:hypothetical protein